MSLSTRSLYSEIAIPALDPRIGAYPVYGGNRLTPDDDTLKTRSEGRGYKVYRDILKDCHAFAVLQKRILAVVKRERIVEPGGTRAIDRKASDALTEALDNLSPTPSRANNRCIIDIEKGFDSASFFLLMAIFYGWATSEIVWEKRGKLIVPAALKSRSQDRFIFSLNTDKRGMPTPGYEMRLLTPNNLFDGEPLPARKFIVHQFWAEDGNPYGWGLASRLFWPVYFKRHLARFALSYADRYGSPTLVGKYPAGQANIRSSILEAFKAFSQETGIAIPKEAEIEFSQPSGDGTALYTGLMDYFDREISKCVLGETGSTDQQGDGGSRARDQVGNEIRVDISKADADLLSETLNHTLCRWFTELNFPDAKPPKIWRAFPELKEQEDLSQRATRESSIVSFMGLKPSREYIEEIYGLPLEEEEKEPGLQDRLGQAFAPEPNSEPEGESPDEGNLDLSEKTVNFRAIPQRVITWNGLKFGVTHLPGWVRFPSSAHAKKLHCGYGHLRGGKKEKGKSIRAFIHPDSIENPDNAGKIFVVEQLNPETQELDERKLMVGWASVDEAREAYLWEMPLTMLGAIAEVGADWLKRHN